MAAKTKKKTTADPLIRQAQLQATVRYGPEKSALRGLAQQAYQTLLTGAKIDQGVAEGIIEAARQAAPQIVAAYQQAGATANGARDMFQSDVSKIGAAADPYRAAAAKESAAAVARIGIASAGAQTELADRQVAAQQGRAFSTQTRARTYQQDVGKVNARLKDLAQEEGSFVEATYGQLKAAKVAADEKAKQQAIDNAYKQGMLEISKGNLTLGQQKLDEATRHDQATETGAGSGSGGVGKTKDGKPTEASNSATKDFHRLIGVYSDGLSQGYTLGQLAKSARKRFGSDAVIAAAADYVTKGRVSGPTRRRLLEEGIALPGSVYTYNRKRVVRIGPVQKKAGQVVNTLGGIDFG